MATNAGIVERQSPLNALNLDSQSAGTGSVPHSAAKAGVANLVRSAGLGYAQTGIRINAVALVMWRRT